MGKAKVSISCVTKFKTGVTEEQSAAISVGKSISCIDDITNKAKREVDKLDRCERKCNSTLALANKKLSELNARLSALESSLANTPPTVKELVPSGTDEEGNTVYEEVEVPNPKYYALLDQISEVQAKISNLRGLINELTQKLREITKAKVTYQSAITSLQKGKSDISTSASVIATKSNLAATQLDKAIKAIKKYLGETVRTTRVPSHTTITWSSGVSVSPSYDTDSFSSKQKKAFARKGFTSNAEGSTVYQESDGTRVTYLERPGDVPEGRKYTNGVVYEGELEFSDGNRNKKTTTIKRKIHQYAGEIDLNYKRADGRTNLQAMLDGDSPMVLVKSSSGMVETRLDLHHMLQQETHLAPDAAYLQGTLLEIPATSHQKYSKVIHMPHPHEEGIRRSFRWIKNRDHTHSRSLDDRQFEAFKKKYWQTRALMALSDQD